MKYHYKSISIYFNQSDKTMKKRKNIIGKAAIVLCIALAMVLPASAVMTKTKNITIRNSPNSPTNRMYTENRDIIFQEGFESYTDFVIEFPPWTNVDLDQGETYGIEDSSGNPYTWPNNYSAQAFIIFNPYTTVPPINDDPTILAHSGTKFAACFADVPSSAPDGNNDWLISPQIHGDSFGEVSFWAKSYTHAYGPEKFYVCVSTTDADPSSFFVISGIDVIEAPEDWTYYSFDLTSYNGLDIYIGINDISYDTFIFMLDDFKVNGTGYVIDTTPPTTTCTLEGTMQGDVYTSDVTVTLNADDPLSGVNYTMYKLDDGNWTVYTEPFVVTDDGTHSVIFYSVDNAGNEEDEKTSSFTIQHAAPLEITIKGGLGVTAIITNIGTTDLTNIDWTIDLDGKLIFLGKSKSDTIASLAAGESITVKDFAIGFGTTGIAVTAGSVEASTSGTIILFLVIGVA
jgi:hypothetical protein